MVASFIILILTLVTIAPIYREVNITEAATGTSQASTITMDITNALASVDLTVSSDNGTFASSSSPISFKVSTNNYTGYTLSIKNSTSSTDLVNSTNSNYVLKSLSTTVSRTNFRADNATGASRNGMWGYLPSKYNSTSYSTTYRPSPTTAGSTLNKTTCANGSSVTGCTALSNGDSYTIGLGARASYNQPAGTYTGTYILNAVGNAIAYTIRFADNSNDSTNPVSGLPSTLSGSVSSTSITLPTTIPTRSNYTFKSWCLGTVSNNGTTCTGTEYPASTASIPSYFGIDQTTTNDTTLYAVWTPVNYTQTVEYYCQSATGTAGTKQTYTESVAYGSTFSFTSSKATGCYNSTSHSSTIYTANNGTNSKTISYTVSGTTTNTAYFNRNTRTISLSKGTGINTVTVTGNGVKSGSGTASATIYYGGTATINATMNTGYNWYRWTNTSGGSQYTTTQNYSISSVTSNLRLTANGNIKTFSCSAEYRLQNADGTYPTAYTSAGVVDSTVAYGSTCTYTSNQSTTYYTNQTTSQTVTDATTLRVDIPRTTYTLTVDRNSSYISSVSGAGTYRWGQSISISATPSNGNKFTAWSQTAGTTSSLGNTASASTTFTMPASNATVYAEGEVDIITIANGSSTTLQSISSKDSGGCPDTLTTGTAYMLKDSRDGQTYAVARLADGNCWLLDNLRLGAVTLKEALSADNTNMSDNVAFTLPSSSTNFSTRTSAKINTATYSSTLSYGSGSGKVGVYYNYCAASAGTICSSANYDDASYDICPKGWKMPKGGTRGHYNDLYIAYSKNITAFRNALHLPLSGQQPNAGMLGNTGIGCFWSSSNYAGEEMHILQITVANGSSNVYPATSDDRMYGNSVRCILK